MPKADIFTTPIRSRRAVLAGMAITAALPIVAPAAAAQTLDAELIELGARFEPLVDRYYVVRKRWASLMVAARAEHDREFGRDWAWDTPGVAAAFDDSCNRWGVREASKALSAIHNEMEPLANAINASPVNSIDGLRAKALVAFWEVAPLGAGDTEFYVSDAYPFQRLFTAVAEVCSLRAKMAATGYELPDISMVDSDDDSDDEGEQA